MKTIFKYELECQSANTSVVKLPRGAIVLKAGTQKNDMFIWALVDDRFDSVERVFEIFGTGTDMSSVKIDNRKYIDTVFLDCGLVYHVFEVIRIEPINVK